MASKSAGEARISIVPDASAFLKKLEADLKAKRYEYKLSVDADTSPAERDIERSRQEQKRKPFETQLDIDVKNAEDKLRALRVREEAKKLGMTVNVDADARRAKLQLDLLRAEAESRKITVRLDADASPFKAALDKMANDLGGGGGGGGIGAALFGGGLTSPGGIGAIVGLLPALSAGVVDVVAAIQQLAQAGLALPGIFAAIGADVGVVKLATNGVSDAFKAVEKASDGSAKNIKAADEALSKLAPQAADFVRQVSALKPAFDGLQNGVQGNFFDGLGKSVKTLVDADLPVLQRGLGGIATAMNENLKQLGASLGSDSSKGLLDRILGNTGDAQTRLSAAIDPLVQGLGHLAAAGTDVLPRLSDDIARVSERFSNFITSADQSGALDKWINDGVTGFEHLGSTLLNIGKSITDITGAVDGGLLQGLDSATQKMEAFLSSPQGQQDLRQFLDEGNQQLHMMGDILGNLGPEFKDAFHGAATGVHEVLAALDGVTSSLRWMQDNIPGVSQALKSLTDPTGAVSDILNVLNGPTPREAAQAKLDAARSHLPGGDVKPAVGGAPGAAVQPPSLPGTAVAPPGTYTPGQNPLLIPGHASGGVLPGYSPGQDNMLVPLAGGEGIVRPEAVRKYGPGVIHMLNQGFAPGGIVPHLGSGALPGPVDGGGSGLGGSFLSGLFGGVPGIGGLLGGNSGSTGGGLTPGLAGLFQAGSNPDLLDQWGSQTGDWLGNFASKTLLSFGTTLWQGALGLVGLQDSILSPSNPYFQDATKAGGFFLGQSGPFGGQGASGAKSKGPTEKQLREGQQKVGRADQKVAEIQQRISELSPDAKASQKQSLANQLANAQQDARDARTDYGSLQSGTTTSSSAGVPSGLSGNQAVVYQSMLDAGYAPSEWGPLKNLLDKESGFDSTARNPKSGAFGMFQFLGHQGDKYGALGGYSTDPAKQAVAGLAYIKDRYGSPSAAWAQYYSHPGGVGWYAQGGGVDTVPAMLTPGEHVLTTSDVAALGGQGGVYRFRNALHFAPGGAVPEALKPQPPRPTFDVPDVKPITRRPTAAVPVPPRLPAPSVSIPPPPPAPEPPRQAPPVGGPAPIGAGGSTGSHTLPAISKGVTAGAAAIGNAAAAAASFGAGGLGGAAGGLIQGLAGIGGKAVNDLIDVGSAFLVGNFSGGTSPNGQYGDTLRPAQNVPVTAPLNQQRTYNIQAGYKPYDLVDALNLMDAQHSQAALASYRG